MPFLLFYRTQKNLGSNKKKVNDVNKGRNGESNPSLKAKENLQGTF